MRELAGDQLEPEAFTFHMKHDVPERDFARQAFYNHSRDAGGRQLYISPD
jgi:hypothetical protein